MKKTLLATLLCVAFAAFAQSTIRTRVSWKTADPSEGVTAYLIKYRTKGSPQWVSQLLPAVVGESQAAILDVTPFGTTFSLQASNAFGLGPESSGTLPSRLEFSITNE